MTAGSPRSARHAQLVVSCEETETPVDLDLFNSRAFHDLHRPSALGSAYFVLRHSPEGGPLAVVHFHEGEQGHYSSPWRGSYGGPQWVGRGKLTFDEMDRFLQDVLLRLRASGGNRCSLVLPPLAYRMAETSSWINVLLRAGFSIVRHELNYAVVVAAPFEEGLDRGNRKQLRKAEREGVTAHELAFEEYETAYRVIEANRQKKGRNPSMSWAALSDMITRFPDALIFFGARLTGTLVAAAICVRVNPQSLYVFYWGEVAGVEHLSPVTLLAQTIHAHCTSSGVTLLDLGTSSIDGIPDPGMIRYKRNLGATESLKLTFTRTL